MIKKRYIAAEVQYLRSTITIYSLAKLEDKMNASIMELTSIYTLGQNHNIDAKNRCITATM